MLPNEVQLWSKNNAALYYQLWQNVEKVNTGVQNFIFSLDGNDSQNGGLLNRITPQIHILKLSQIIKY